MLTLVVPAALGALAALVPVAFFYFLRMRFRRQPVSSTFLWDRLVRTTEGGARLRWRSILLLVLQALAVLLLALALAGPRWVAGVPGRPGTVYLVDTSASMGGTRLDQARQAVLADLKTLDPRSPVVVFGAAGELDPAGSSFEAGQGGEAASRLAQVRAGSGAFDEGAVAGALRTWIQTQAGGWSTVVVTDGGLDQGGSRLAEALGGRLRALATALPRPNRGLEDVRVGDFPAPGVRVTLFEGEEPPQAVTLVLTRDGRELARRPVTPAPGPSTLTWEVPAVGTPPVPGLYDVAFDRGTDDFPADDRFAFAVNPPRPARILHLGPTSPFVRAAFPGAEFVERTNLSTDGGPWDLVVVEGPDLPEGWTGNLLTFGALPPGAPVFEGPPVSGTVTGSAAAPPLSRWVPWTEVQVEGARGLGTRPGASVLAEAGGWPVAVTWDRGGFRTLAVTIDLGRSNFGLTPALPILVRNFRQACVPGEDNPLADNLRVGVPALRRGSPDWHLVSATSPGGLADLTAVRRGGLWEVTARQAGTFVWADGRDSGALTAHLPAGESDTAPRALTFPNSGAGSAPAGEQRFRTEDLTPWLALAVLGLLGAEWRLWNGRWGRRANPGLALVRLAAGVCVLVGAVGIVLILPTTDRNLVLLFDTSASVGPTLVAQERAAATDLVTRLGPRDRVALVGFAGTPRVVAGLQTRDLALRTLGAADLTPAGDAEATDLTAALVAGAQLLAREPGSSSQLVFTDGRTNRGGDLDALPAAARRYPVSAVPVGRPLGGVSGQGLDVPASVRPGEPFRVRWTGTSDDARPLALTLAIDGQPLQTRKLALTPGPVTAEFTLAAPGTGTHRVDVLASDARGVPLPSAQASAYLTVDGRASILLVRGAATTPALGAALAAQGLPVAEGPLPTDAAGYRGIASVVLDNIPARALTPAQAQGLKDWVSAGGGLLVVGGDSSLGRGEYYGSPLEDLVPVQTDTRQRLQFTRSRVLFVVDHSGSMGEDVGRTTKLKAAVSGVAQAIGNLTIQDEVGILEFDTEPTWVLPFTPMTQKQAVLGALDRFSDGGGTDLKPALDTILQAFGPAGPIRRHVILLTDGQADGSQEFFQNFTAALKAAQISLTVLGIGNEVNETLLASLATQSEGVYYRAQGSDIPALLKQETVRMTRDLIQEGRFVPMVTGRASLMDLGAPLPEVRGYLVTRAKPAARVLWTVGQPGGPGDPLFADWRFGSGRVAVFTSDSGSRWTSGWGADLSHRFWAQVVRSLETSDQDRGLNLSLTVSASVAHVVVEALEAGRLKTGASLAAHGDGGVTPLVETAPGRYEADVPLKGPGLQQVTVVDRDGAGRTWAWAWSPPGAELARGGADWAALGRLTSTTGGQLEPLAAPQPPDPVWTWAPADLRFWGLLAGLLLFLVELGVRSTSLGQAAQARALFLRWWADQTRPWAKEAAPAPRNVEESERRTRDAYRSLAARRSTPTNRG